MARVTWEPVRGEKAVISNAMQRNAGKIEGLATVIQVGWLASRRFVRNMIPNLCWAWIASRTKSRLESTRDGVLTTAQEGGLFGAAQTMHSRRSDATPGCQSSSNRSPACQQQRLAMERHFSVGRAGLAATEWRISGGERQHLGSAGVQ